MLGYLDEGGAAPFPSLLAVGAEHLPAGDVEHSPSAELRAEIDDLAILLDGVGALGGKRRRGVEARTAAGGR